MPDGSRVPGKISAFNEYIDSTDKLLQSVNKATGNPYYVDYGIDAATAAQWSSRRINWDKNVYAAYINPTTSTSIAKENVQHFIKDFRVFARPVLAKIVASGVAGSQEEQTFRFKLVRKDPTTHRTAIKKDCSAGFRSLGGGRYKITCLADKEAGRAHKVEGADSVQFAYTISPQPPKPSPTPDDGTMTLAIATRAIFIQNFGSANLACWLTIYFRWYNTKHPLLAGPWSPLYILPIA